MVDAATPQGQSPKPQALAVNPEHIPDELKALHQCVCWRYEYQPKRNPKKPYTKVPYSVRTRRRASSTNPETWDTFEAVLACYQKNRQTLDGIGVVLCKDNHVVGIDLDHCRDPATGVIEGWAWETIRALKTYTEISPSGTGIRCFAQGALPGGGKHKGDVEIYDQGRYLTVTGHHLEGTPATIEPRQDAISTIYAHLTSTPKSKPRTQAPHPNGQAPRLEDDQLLTQALAARNGRKLARLLSGDTSAHPSHSEADLALCSLLAFWTQDAAQLDRLFRGSGLYRDKWDEVHGQTTYGQATVQLALSGAGEHWTPGKPSHTAQAEQAETNGSTSPPPDVDEDADVTPIIRISPDLTAMVNLTQAFMLSDPQGPHVFQRGRQLCLIARGVPHPKWLRRPADVPVIVPAEPAYLRELAAQIARWEKHDGRKKGWVWALPPTTVIDTLMARPSWTFPLLEGVIGTPTLRPDGSWLTTPGYDPDTALWLDFNGTTYPTLLERPTLDDARTAIGRLQQVFIDFPFAALHHFSAALAAVCTLVARYAIQGNVPLVAVRSTTPGSGKGLLVDAISVIATGRMAPRWAVTSDKEEERKRLLTIAMAGDALVHLDNVTHAFGSAALDLALTAPTFSDRILGVQQQREAPMQVVFFASGNNMVFQGDMVRRVVPIDLAPTMERPEERKDFTHNPLLRYVLTERPALVGAALTILKGYVVAGSPAQGITALGGFDEWSTLVRQALIWAGEADPCAGRQDLGAESDPQYEAFQTLLTTWYACYGTTTKTVRQVLDQIRVETAKELLESPWDALRDALGSLDPQYSTRGLNPRTIGDALRTWKGRMIGGKRLVRTSTTRMGLAEWRIEVIHG
jgi:hypothetical protein